MNPLALIEKLIFESAAWRLVAAIFALSLVKTGVWYIPNLEISRNIAVNPFVNSFSDPILHYIFWTWLGPFLAWLLGATERLEFFIFHLAFSFAFTALFIKLVFDNLSDELARTALVLFAILPVSGTSYYWVGPDSITLFLITLALAFPSSLIFVFFVGILLGMQHFEQGIFAATGLLFASVGSLRQGCGSKYTWRFSFFLLLGVIAGKAALFFIFYFYAVNVTAGRIYWLLKNIDSLIENFLLRFQVILWSVFGLGWFIALRFVELGIRSAPFFLSLAGLCLLLPILADHTRVLSIVTFPLVCVYWLFNQDFLSKLNKREISMLFSIWILMPWAWVWVGAPKWSVFPYDIAYIVHRFFGWFKIPENLSLWPFLGL